MGDENKSGAWSLWGLLGGGKQTPANGQSGSATGDQQTAKKDETPANNATPEPSAAPAGTAAAPKSTTPTPTLGAASGNVQWNCGACTFLNDCDRQTCYQCDTPKPTVEPMVAPKALEGAAAGGSDVDTPVADPSPEEGKKRGCFMSVFVWIWSLITYPFRQVKAGFCAAGKHIGCISEGTEDAPMVKQAKDAKQTSIAWAPRIIYAGVAFACRGYIWSIISTCLCGDSLFSNPLGDMGSVTEMATGSYTGMIMTGIVVVWALNYFIGLDKIQTSLGPLFDRKSPPPKGNAVERALGISNSGVGEGDERSPVLITLLICGFIALVSFLVWKFCIKKPHYPRLSGAAPRGFGGFWPKRKSSRRRSRKRSRSRSRKRSRGRSCRSRGATRSSYY